MSGKSIMFGTVGNATAASKLSSLHEGKGEAAQRHSPTAISSCALALGLSRVRLLTCLRQLLIKFTVADGCDHGIDHRRQIVERRHDDCSLAFPEFDALPALPNEKHIGAVRRERPP
jgi:hypothetical protein